MVLQSRVFFRFLCFTMAFGLFSVSSAWSQESTNDEPAPAASAEAGDVVSPADAYAAKMTEWKSLLKELRVVKGEYEEGDDSQVVAIQKRWDALMTKGEVLIDELRDAGMKAFAAAPNSDRQLSRFLVKILEDDVARDSYENAARLSQALLDNGYDETQVFEKGGIAAFCTNSFDKAEQYFSEVRTRGSLSTEGQKFASLVGEYKTFWEQEQAIRKKEAEADDLPRVKITTTQGELTVELFENEAPETVANFVNLIEREFYNGLLFHRVMKGFMAQGGCPQGNGSGGPGYNIYCECHNDNYRNHFRGTLSMAHAGRDTGGSQFFITFVPTAHLNNAHTAFGRVIGGMDVLTRIQRTDDSKGTPDKIVKMEVLRKRDHEYVPNKVQ